MVKEDVCRGREGMRWRKMYVGGERVCGGGRWYVVGVGERGYVVGEGGERVCGRGRGREGMW